MTTKVTIKNEETSGHSIEVKFSGQVHSIAPGNSITTHVWQGNDITVKELLVIPEVLSG